MGCCENIHYLIGRNNKDLSMPFHLSEIKSGNTSKLTLSSPIKVDKNEIMNSPFKTNLISKLQFDDYKKNIILDKINEEESEYKESSVNTKITKIEKESPKKDFKDFQNLMKNKINKRKYHKYHNNKSQDKNRSHPKFQTILTDDKFNKKLNEYKNHINMKKIFYLNNLTKKKEKKSNDFIFEKSMDDLSFKRDIFETICEKQNKRAIRNVRFKLFNESLDQKYN